MGFMAEVQAEVSAASGQGCRVARVLNDITDKDFRVELIETIRSPDQYSAAAIARVLRAHDIDLTAPVIQYHRRNECKCPPETKPPETTEGT